MKEVKGYKQCSVNGCTNKHYGKGFCKKHHQYMWVRGLLPASEPTINLFWKRTDKKGEDECWNWTAGKDSNGYGSFKIGGFERAHRYSYSRFVGKIKNGLHILHKCNNSSCVNPKHLYAGTHQQNMKDMANSGIQKGTKQPKSTITEGIAVSIMDYLLSGLSKKKVSEKLNIEYHIVSSVAYGASWSWVDGMKGKVEKYRKMNKKNNFPKGEDKSNSKLTEIEAKEIFKSNGRHKDIAERYGVSKTLVSNIKRKVTWKHIHN